MYKVVQPKSSEDKIMLNGTFRNEKGIIVPTSCVNQSNLEEHLEGVWKKRNLLEEPLSKKVLIITWGDCFGWGKSVSVYGFGGFEEAHSPDKETLNSALEHCYIGEVDDKMIFTISIFFGKKGYHLHNGNPTAVWFWGLKCLLRDTIR